MDESAQVAGIADEVESVYTARLLGYLRNDFVSPAPQCQPGTSVHKVHVNCVSHVTPLYLLTHPGCVYNRSM
jgi:hypothetical protein